MPWRPSAPGERPTLGHYVLDWIIENLAAPDREVYEPFVPTREQAEFVLAFYELDPVTCRRMIRRGVLSRCRGWGKSPFLAALAITEGLADVYPDGWDANGQPVGRPWATVRTPLVQIAAASEEQTSNSWEPVLEMLDGDAPVFDNYDGIEPMATFVNLPRGRIMPVTTSSTALKGKRPVLVIMDQTEQWTPGNRAVEVAQVIINNATKVGGAVIESPNAYIPGMDSQAERTAKAYFAMQEGRTRRDRGLLYDHREAPGDTLLDDEVSLVAGLRYAYGDSSDHADGCVLHDPPCAPGWAPISNFVDRIYDVDADEQVSRSDFLNQITHASDAWIEQPVWAAVKDEEKLVLDGELITLGFDGSRGRAKGKPDATALIGCRVEDGHLFELGVWECDDKFQWDAWTPPIVEIEAAIADAFKRYTVAGFYADPAKDWRSHVNAWEARWGARPPAGLASMVKASAAHPFEWWMTGGRASLVERAIESLEGAIRNGDMTHSGSYKLTTHVLAARRRLSHKKLALGKSSDYSVHKIDAAAAAVLAWQCRLDAVAAGIQATPKTASIIRAR